MPNKFISGIFSSNYLQSVCRAGLTFLGGALLLVWHQQGQKLLLATGLSMPAVSLIWSAIFHSNNPSSNIAPVALITAPSAVTNNGNVASASKTVILPAPTANLDALLPAVKDMIADGMKQALMHGLETINPEVYKMLTAARTDIAVNPPVGKLAKPAAVTIGGSGPGLGISAPQAVSGGSNNAPVVLPP